MAKKDLNLFDCGLVSYWLLGLICVAPRVLEITNHVQLVFFDRLYANLVCLSRPSELSCILVCVA
jgi:hypothetical protein